MEHFSVIDSVIVILLGSIFTFLFSVAQQLKLSVRPVVIVVSVLVLALIIILNNQPLLEEKTLISFSLLFIAGAAFSLRRRILNLARSTQHAHALKLEEKVGELKKSEEQLRSSQVFLDSVLENVPIMVFVKDAENLKFVRVNRASEPLIGHSRRELIGKSDHDVFPAELADRFTQQDRQVLQGKSIVDIPEELISTPNGMRTLHTRKIPILDVSGKPEYLLGISEDITDWKLAQAQTLKLFGDKIALEERERSARQTQFLADATTVLASSFEYVETLRVLGGMFVNNQVDWCTITLMRDDHSIERTVAVHKDPLKQALLDEFVDQVPKNQNDPNGVAEVIRTGLTIHRPLIHEADLKGRAHSERHLELIKALGSVSAVIVPIKIRSVVHGAIAIVSSSADKLYDLHDVAITEEVGRRAGTAIENAKLYEAVQRAVQSRDEFLSIASHELKTPLTALKLQLEFARRQTKPEQNLAPSPDKIAKMLDSSSQQVNRLTMLVDDLLDVSRIEAGKLNFKFETLDAVGLTGDVVERCRDQIQLAKSTITIDFSAQPIFVKADRFRLEQVILNVLSNAIKYGGGSLIEMKVLEKNHRLHIICRDHGMGIPAGKTEKIFERFERAVEATHITGLGLGLYIAHEIVAAHDGTIRAESILKEGSTFTIEMPVVQSSTLEARL